jgi:putative restriction endonuclease
METEIRAAAFQWIRSQYDAHGGTIPREVLENGFVFQGQRITVIGPSGIWKPRQFETMPLSITTVPGGPYDDSFTPDGLLIYRYRGTDPNHRDNVGLREAMRTRTPLIYLHGIVPGRYLPVWPVFIIDDHPQTLSCLVAIDPAYALGAGEFARVEPIEAQSAESMLGVRRYVAAYTLRRLHQTAFRETVITAYSTSCTLCRLRHRELLDAAHIIPDTEPMGDPVIQNGLCLCKIHHAAFDQNLVGIDSEYTIHVRDDVLLESDGPMLLHGLQELHHKKMVVPSRHHDRPDLNRLELRFKEFRKAV